MVFLLVVIRVNAGSPEGLRVFLADNHSETGCWIARTFDPDERHQLVLVDAHSDASAADRSEEMREEMRRVTSEKERDSRFRRWREAGRLQAFNWIEPLMPRPLDHVLWLAAPVLDGKRRATLTAEATDSLDGRLEVEPRSAGSFEKRWQTCDLKGFNEWQSGSNKVILAIDLDFFAGMKPDERETAFASIWERAMDWPGLQGVAFAVSRPWLADDGEADALVSLAVDAVRRTRGAVLELDASVDDSPDNSRKAAELNQQVSRWDFARASHRVRSELGALGSRLTVTDRGRAWNPSEWACEMGYIVSDQGEIDCDSVWRFPSGSEPVLRIGNAGEWSGRTRWFSLEPVRDAYDLLPETGLGKSFAKSPGRWIYEKRRSLGETTDFQLDPAAWRRAGGGRFVIEAEVETPHGWLLVPPVELRIRTAEGFRGSLSECGGMPYVFGIAGVEADDLSGVETGWGSDCGNLLVHAWRRNGIPLTWGDPGRIRAQLVTRAEDAGVSDGIKISHDEIERGIVIDFGKHMAALWKDREPLGELDANDRVMHHLGGLPELVTLGDLAKDRPDFAVRLPASPPSCRVAFAGDVVLAGEEREVCAGFGKQDADLFVVNLEGIPSLLEPHRKPRHDFRFPPGRIGWLKEKGVDAVSLANNHAGDAGSQGVIEGMRVLREAGIEVFGAGANEEDACRPWLVERKGVRLAVFGISYFDNCSAGPGKAGVASLPRHREELERQLLLARAGDRQIIALVHGGKEYDERVEDTQREWARWLTARGVSTIVGAHPHVIQREERHAGASVFHSLGNAVYPKELKGLDSGGVKVAEILGWK